MPIKKKNHYTMQVLSDCLEEVKAWLALIFFLKFKENETQVLSFELGVTGGHGPSFTAWKALGRQFGF